MHVDDFIEELWTYANSFPMREHPWFRGIAEHKWTREQIIAGEVQHLNLGLVSGLPAGLPRGMSRLCVATFGKCLKLRCGQPEDGSIRGPTTGLQPRRPSIERHDGLSIHDDGALDQERSLSDDLNGVPVDWSHRQDRALRVGCPPLQH